MSVSIETMLARPPLRQMKKEIKHLSEKQRADKDLGQIIENTIHGDTDRYRMRNGILEKKINDEEWRTCLPTSSSVKLIGECHELHAHVGPDKV